MNSLEERLGERRHDLNTIRDSLKRMGSHPEEVTKEQRVANALKQAIVVHKNVLMAGDLNYHYPIETEYLLEEGFVDLWVQKHPDKPGYTWDPTVSTFLNVLRPFDNRRLRLDRIALAEGSSLFDVEDMRVFANDQKIGRYLFPSDHFGLVAKMAIKVDNVPFKRNFQE